MLRPRASTSGGQSLGIVVAAAGVAGALRSLVWEVKEAKELQDRQLRGRRNMLVYMLRQGWV